MPVSGLIAEEIANKRRALRGVIKCPLTFRLNRCSALLFALLEGCERVVYLLLQMGVQERGAGLLLKRKLLALPLGKLGALKADRACHGRNFSRTA